MHRHSDKKLLAKGMKYLAISLPLLFLSPYLLTIAFLNKGHWSLYLFLVIGVLVGAAAIFLIFKALKILMKAIFMD